MTDLIHYYLKPNVQIEPLINKWHAYPFVISPAAAAMVIANYQMTTMKSYLQMPMAHVAALKNPDMVGGPFIDYNGGRLPEIKALKEHIEYECGDLIQLSEAIKTLFRILKEKAKGFPLEDLYSEIPEALRGYVELCYDLENQPTFRLIERLLYQSPYYKKDNQTISLQIIDSDERSFIFSTPRLDNQDNVQLPLSFDDARIDQLINLKREPQPFQKIKEMFQIPDEKEEIFHSFLSVEPPTPYDPYSDDGVRVRYYGHACVLIETKNVSILTDPLISYKYESAIDRFTFENLPETIDYVVITHTHHDHIVIETLLQLRTQIKNIIVPKSGTGYLQDPSMKLILEQIGFDNVMEIDDMEQIKIPDGTITGVPFFGEHCDLNIRSKSAYHLELLNKTFLMVADSSSINPDVYRQVHKTLGDVDTLFVGMECTGAPMSWSYGAFLPGPVNRELDQVRRSKGSNSKTALQLVDIFNTKEAYLYAMGVEPWLNYFMALQHDHSSNTEEESDQFIIQCQNRGCNAESLFAKKEIEYLHEPA